MARNPDYEFVPLDVAELMAQMVADYEGMTGEALSKASPEYLMISWVASIIQAERVKSNYAANQNLPSRAEGEKLDALAELFYAQRRPAATPAVCTMRFFVSEPETAVLIPAGTRVTDGAKTLYWETSEDVWIPGQNTYVDVQVRCQTAGTVGNGWEPGTINTIVDVYDYYTACENITASDGAADAPTDEEFYELLKTSMGAYSVAGPTNAYVYHAKSVSAAIADVRAVRPRRRLTEWTHIATTYYGKMVLFGAEGIDLETLQVYPDQSTEAAVLDTDYRVTLRNGMVSITVLSGGCLDSLTSSQFVRCMFDSTGAGEVVLYVLMDDGSIAGEEVKAAVLAACSDRNVRPLTDLVSVKDPLTVSYDIDFTYYLSADSTASAADTQAAVEAAVDQYKAWQSAKLGRDINPSYLIGLLMQTGIKRVELTAPTFTTLFDGSDGFTPQVAVIDTVNIVNGGVEDE